MTFPIFCPSNHLVLDLPHCPLCGWQRPQATEVGKPRWGPFTMNAGIGGPGRHVLATPAVVGGVVVFPLRCGELVALDLSDGKERWRAKLPAGLMTRELVADDERLLCTLSDERSLEQASGGRLISVNPQDGSIETLWQASGHQLSSPMLADENILLRVSGTGLVCLSRWKQPEELWRVELQSWWPLAPSIEGEQVFLSDGRLMSGQCNLKAFSISDGSLAWEVPSDGFLSSLPAFVQDTLAFVDGRKHLQGVETSSGKLTWRKSFKRIYTPPVAGEDEFYLVVRGDDDAGGSRRYLLTVFDPKSGEFRQQFVLPERVSVCPLFNDGLLFMAMDSGNLLALDPQQGEVLWSYLLGGEDDPPGSTLLLDKDVLVAGSYSGRLTVIQVSTPVVEPPDPQVCLENEDIEGAAAAFALHGDYERSAQIYARELEQPERAFALYEHAGLQRPAAVLAEELGLYDRALVYYEALDDVLAQAEQYRKMGNLMDAADRYRQGGKLDEAARFYEEAELYRPALECYKELGKNKEVRRLRKYVPYSPGDVDMLEQQQKWMEAGEASLAINDFERAAHNFSKAEDSCREYDALLQRPEAERSEWANLRIAEVARSKGDYLIEAQAWERVGRRSGKCADAYLRAAWQKEQTDPGQERDIADLYEKAGYFFEDMGENDEKARCRSQVIYYRHLPYIIVEGHSEKTFREGEFNVLELDITNQGRGVAHDVRVSVDTSRFEVDEKTSNVFLRRLAAGKSEKGRIFLRPLDGQVGDVPFELRCQWSDRDGRSDSECTCQSILVKKVSDTSSSSQPVIIQPGAFYVQGSYFGGDKMEAGSQKGDRVEVHREGKLTRLLSTDDVADSAESDAGAGAKSRTCPVCHLKIEPDADFCYGCGNKLAADDDQQVG